MGKSPWRYPLALVNWCSHDPIRIAPSGADPADRVMGDSADSSASVIAIGLTYRWPVPIQVPAIFLPIPGRYRRLAARYLYLTMAHPFCGRYRRSCTVLATTWKILPELYLTA